MEATTYQEVQGLSRMTVGELRDKYINEAIRRTNKHMPRSLFWNKRKFFAGTGRKKNDQRGNSQILQHHAALHPG